MNITVVPCPAKGQTFRGGCIPFHPTCSHPHTLMICDTAFCVCPDGQVLDEDINACVNVSQCCK